MITKFVRLVFLLMLVVFYPTNVTFAQVEKVTADNWELPLHIQMLPIMVRARSGSKPAFATPISVFVQVTKKKYVGSVCKRLPRLTSKILQIFSREPIKIVRGQLDLQNTGKLLLKPLNKSLGKRVIRKLYVYQGVMRMDAGVSDKIPFSHNTCLTILRLSDELRKAKAKENASK